MRVRVHAERSFGVSVGSVLLLVGAYSAWHGRMNSAQWSAGIGLVLIALGLLRPALLKYPSALWWRLALVLGFINTRILLGLAFALVLAPIGLAWRLLGRDPLNRRRRNWTGWTPSPARYRDPHHYQRMY